MSNNASKGSPGEPGPNNFLRQIIQQDIDNNTHGGQVVTRFPPEPNGYLHIGHAKSICLNFGLANFFGGKCNLRFDDTNPEKESPEYVAAIKEDVQWLGFEWDGDERYSSSYFGQLYEWAVTLIKQGKAYVCHLSADEAREYRGTLTAAGKNSPYRERDVAENLALFARMKNGEFEEGVCTLRAKIDMASPNINLRDPIIYRIRKVVHHQTGDDWCIYPSYDFTHGQSDALEHITHSICTLEFEDHRPLYDWFIENLPVPSRPRQYEFAPLNLTYTITSKRKLKRLVEEGVVSGWDDPRMPTISGMRRRGYTSASIRNFCDRIGVTRSEGTVDVSMLEHALREDLDRNAPRAMCVLDPIKLIISNYRADQREDLIVPAHPQREEMGQRTLPLTREIYIDRADFREEANKKYKRLVLGKEVRLRNAYVVRAEKVVKDEAGGIVAVHCTYDPDTLGKKPADGRKVKGVIHWVSASGGVKAEVRLYDRLFNTKAPDRGEADFLTHVNEASLKILTHCWIEPGLASAAPQSHFQFEREGYFVADQYDHQADHPVFNKTIGLRDTWAKIENAESKK